ncbi:MAG: hypothetical protein IPK16_01520 [Anaerolineales bacterium]|nr:hypothetical protein [Anaerolineales bacterium]
MRSRVHRALRALHHATTEERPLADLRLYQQAVMGGLDGRQATRTVLQTTVGQMAAHYPDEAPAA